MIIINEKFVQKLSGGSEMMDSFKGVKEGPYVVCGGKYLSQDKVLCAMAILSDMMDSGINLHSRSGGWKGFLRSLKFSEVVDVTRLPSLSFDDDKKYFKVKGEYYYGTSSQVMMKTKAKEKDVKEAELELVVKSDKKRRVLNAIKASKAFEEGDTAKIGSMVWAEAMGMEMRRGMSSQFKKDISKGCGELKYLDADEVLKEYTKDHLYFIGKGLGLDVTRKMTRPQLCQLIREELV